MSLAIYQSYLDYAPKQYKFLKLLRPLIYVIELLNNQLIATCYYKEGSSKQYQINADFSNRRMPVANFNNFLKAIVELLLKFPSHFLWINAIVFVNVDETLIDGLTSIEVKVITEALFVGSAQAKRKIVHITVSYQGQVVPLEKFG
ncbi:hypothetical protein [Psychrobacter sp.]|uniref:hypothetical protein n=1 Tax=unclassified Psychrobacter TaxID=196806 RepID=UPI003F957BF0